MRILACALALFTLACASKDLERRALSPSMQDLERRALSLSMQDDGLRARRSSRMVPDEAQAVLEILDKRAAGKPIADRDWTRLFATEGYVRLKAREHSMRREFEDETFRKFVMSDELLARRSELAATVVSWLRADVTRAAQRALAYLPEGSRLKAKIYPVIKPATNSFVFDLQGDPAIFLYVEPQPREVFEATVAHELHHVGYANNCPENDSPQWFGAFGEGLATLAAAGGPDGTPQLRPEVAAEWTKQMARFDENFRKVDEFLSAVARGELDEEQQRKRGFDFFGMVGPWYTIGWKMAVVVETVYGRDALTRSICDPRQWMRLYHDAIPEWEKRTGEQLPRWSVPL